MRRSVVDAAKLLVRSSVIDAATRIVRRTIVVAAALVGLSALGFVAWVAMPLPAALLRFDDGAGIRIEDRNGIVLRSTRSSDGSRTRWVPLGEIDADLIAAFVAVEDRRFWEHHGVDVRAVARAARDNLLADRVVSGASTISMQLARLLHPRSRGWSSKLHEALWAVRIEAHLDKQEILEQYLNRVHLGQAAVGVGAAVPLYFGAAASEVSVAEAAMLAGLAHAPSRDNPLVAPKRAAARRDVALARMRRAGAIGRDDAARAAAEPVLARRETAPFLAPHFTTRLLEREARSDEAGSAPAATIWRTTLDAGLQREIEGEVRHAVGLLAPRGVRHAAVIVLENRTGDVLAWIGSPDFWAARNGQTDMVTSARQPGSTLKPFLYALAFDRGTTAATVLPDIPRSYATATGAYEPRNYDRRFRGPVRVREALASSYNVPAVEVAERIGTGAFLHTLHLAGFESLSREADHYGLGLALGNGDVTLLELANAYRGLANGGTWSPARWIEGARADDAVASGERRFVSTQAAALVLDILADPSARVPGFGIQTPFEFPFPVAVKTGTSRHFTDNWAVATTRGFTVAVWVGNFGGEPMQGVSGVSGAGPLLHRAVMLTAQRYVPGAILSPADAGLSAMKVCRLSGLRATPTCPAIREWFIAGTTPTRADDWMVGGRVVLPAEYAEWAADEADGSLVAEYETAESEAAGWRGADHEAQESEAAVADTDRLPAGGSSSTGFRIVAPLDGDVYRVPPGVPGSYATIPLLAAGSGDPVRWSVDGRPHTGGRWSLISGTHVIRAESAGVIREVRIRVE